MFNLRRILNNFLQVAIKTSLLFDLVSRSALDSTSEGRAGQNALPLNRDSERKSIFSKNVGPEVFHSVYWSSLDFLPIERIKTYWALAPVMDHLATADRPEWVTFE